MPLGIKMTMKMKVSPSNKFHRSMKALTINLMVMIKAAPTKGPKIALVPPEMIMSKASVEAEIDKACGLMN